MIRKEDISSRTNKGLDIIRHLYPDAGRVIDSGNLKQAFKVRNERTPSAHLKEYELWWVEAFFHPLCVGHLDSYLVLDEVLADYRGMTGDVGMTQNSLRRKIGEWVACCDYVADVNPSDLCTLKPDPGRHNGRILRRRLDADGNPSGSPVDFIYLRTDPEVYPRTKAECEAAERDL